ncbi:MAG: DUF4198 domain-containing protein [Acidobacteriota bacterium]|nr:MAG: DUF4198 domain-containing protein [Acidobacteriota bacterium]
MKTKTLFVTLAIIALAANAFAHEYWFEPGSFFLKPGDSTPIHLYVGDGLSKDLEEREYQPDMTPMFSLFFGNGATDVRSSLAAGQTPVHKFSASEPGNYLLAMHRDWAYITLEPEEFEAYLREDGMGYIIAERRKLGETDSPGKERYSRYLKSLIQVGDAQDENFGRDAGLKLEITPDENPYSKRLGSTLSFTVKFDGKPLAGKTVFASNRSTAKQKLRTDRNGRVRMRINAEGLWLVHLVFMQRCASECGEADWESFWGAYSFGVR